MRSRVFCLIVFMMCFASAVCAATTASLLGRWELTAEFAEEVPVECKDGYIEITPDKLITVSREQVLTADYNAVFQRDRAMLYMTNLASNGEPNCQGYSAEVALRNFAKIQIWKWTPTSVKVLAPRLIMELHRVEEP